MAGLNFAEADRAVDEMIKKYGHETTSLDVIVNFFKGVYSYPDDFGMALAVTAGGLGLLGPTAYQNSLMIRTIFSSLICEAVENASWHNLWYMLTKYWEYLQTKGRWKSKLASTAGRTIGGYLTNYTLRRIQIENGIDPNLVNKWERLGVTASMAVLTTYGAACNAIFSGERTFLALLNKIVTGEIDRELGRLELDFRFNAPWRELVPKDGEEVVRDIRPLLSPACRYDKSIRR
jgi:hypothetical protein